MRIQYCDNPGDWREVESDGYATAAFKGWKCDPPTEFAEHEYMGRIVLTDTRRIGGRDYILAYNEQGLFDWLSFEQVYGE